MKYPRWQPPDSGLMIAFRDRLTPLQHQLSLSHLVCLFTIAAEPGLSINDLGARIGAPQASASRYASILLGRYQGPDGKAITPLIVQKINEDDPRRRALHLSDLGQEIIGSLCNGLSLTRNSIVGED